VSQYAGGPNLYVEGVIALVIAGAFVLFATTVLRERHRDVEQWHVAVGAAIYGAVIGIVVGFVIVPLRMVLMNGHVATQTAALSGLGLVSFTMALRRGLIGRLPFLGPQVKAYRRALLRRTIEAAQKQLDKLTAPAAAE
jgi:ABC-type uncharacterized transport system permease subunit